MNNKLEIGLHIAIWIFVTLIHAWVFTQFFEYRFSLLRSMGNVLPMTILFYVNLWLVNHYLENKKYGQYGLIVFLIFALASFFRSQLNTQFPDISEQVFNINRQNGWILGALFTNLTVLVIGTFYQILYNRFQQEKQNLAIINEQREAQLQSLRAQINPHFLFNTLNNIYSLAVVKSDKTADMVLKLSSLLRYVIYEGRAEQVSLKKEARQISEFIELFQMRSEEPLDIEYRTQGISEDHMLEPTILIPIVENCFKHCDFDTNPDAFIAIDLLVQNNELVFQTINTKNDSDKQKDEVGGVGLENIRKRLELKYPNRYELSIQDEPPQFLVKLKLQLSHGRY